MFGFSELRVEASGFSRVWGFRVWEIFACTFGVDGYDLIAVKDLSTGPLVFPLV